VNRESSTLSKEPLADTKQVRKPGNEQEKPKNGYIVSHVNRESSTSEEILPLLQSLLVQNDIQRVCVLSVSTASCGYTSPKWLLRFGF
jgi:serine/threonine-protein kinase OSR1/STK39